MTTQELQQIIDAIKAGFSNVTINVDVKSSESTNTESTNTEITPEKWAEQLLKKYEAEQSFHSKKIEKQIEKIKATLETDIDKKTRKRLEKDKNRLEVEKENLEAGGKKKLTKEEEDEEIKNKRESVISGIEKLNDGIIKVHTTYWKSHLKESENAYDKIQKIFKTNLELSKTITQNIGSELSSITTSTATATQRTVTQNAREEANARIKYLAESNLIEQEFRIAEQRRTLEAHDGYLTAGTAILGSIAAISAALAGPTAGVSLIVGGLAAGIAGIWAWYEGWKEIDIERQEFSKKIYQETMDNVSQTTDQIKSLLGSIDEATNSITDVIRESETLFRQTGLVMGLTGDKFDKYILNAATMAAKTFGLTAQQMMEMQNSYISASGRQVLLESTDYDKIEAMARTFGISASEVATMMGDMNIFNVSVQDSYNIFDSMYDMVNKIGLSTTKFSKSLTDNLKLAQKYNFKGGVDNMAKLTLWAEKTRFNLQSATSFADKMMSNNIGDVLETTSKLHVLGGAGAMFADPFAMMYEAGNDVGALAQRQYEMFSDITGTFNKTTGETKFSSTELKLAKARAEAMGINYEDVLNQRRQANKQSVVDKHLAGFGLDETTRIALSNRATYDKSQGTFVVNTMDGVLKLSDFKDKSAKEINELLLPQDEKDSILDIARTNRSMVQTEEAILKHLQMYTGVKYYDVMKESSKTSIDNQVDLYKDDNFQNQIGKTLYHNIDLMGQQTKDLIKFLQDNDKPIDEYRAFVLANLADSYQLQDQQTKYLAILAGKDGIEQMSIYASEKSNILGGKSKNKQKELYDDALSRHKGGIIGDLLELELGSQFQNDGVGLLNGSYITNASNVKSINDGIVKTHIADEYMAAKPNGPIDKLFNGIIAMIQEMYANQGGKSGVSTTPLNVRLDGRLDLSQNNSNINLVEIIKRDPVQSRDLIRILMKALDSTQHGKITTLHNI